MYILYEYHYTAILDLVDSIVCLMAIFVYRYSSCSKQALRKQSTNPFLYEVLFFLSRSNSLSGSNTVVQSATSVIRHMPQ